jgi:predicted RNA-binding protein with RPS1 domain
LELEKQTADDATQEAREIKAGETVTGVIDSVQDYGVFVKLPGDKTGLLHLSEIENPKSMELKRRFPVGGFVEVKVLSVDNNADRISLSVKALSLQAEERQIEEYRTKSDELRSFGTLGDILKEKLFRK